jgi:hypothetical protein
MDMNGRNMKDYMTTIRQQQESNLNKHQTILIAINDRLDDTNRLISSGNSVTNKLADALRLDWLRQLGTELKGYMRRIIAMNVATYHAVISIQSALPGRLERGLIEEPFILEDAVGRIAPVHLQFVTSWDAFNAVLEIRFREMQGFKKVKQKQYGLQDKATKRDIEQTRPWQRAFLPGQRIEMSFLFDAQNNQGGVGDVTCPGCQTISLNPTDTEIQCENCRMWFRRITIIQDVEPQSQAPIPSPWRSQPGFGRVGFTGMVSGPVRPGKKRVAPVDVDGEDDLREFKRVRLVTRKERTRMQAFERRKDAHKLRTFSTLSTAKPESSKKTWKFHHGVETQSSQAQGLGSSEEYERTQVSSTTQPLDLEEMVKQELMKAREAGLLSKAVPDASKDHTAKTEDRATRIDIDRVAPARETFWNSKWFPPQAHVSEAVELFQQAPESAIGENDYDKIQQASESAIEENEYDKMSLLDFVKIGRKHLLKLKRAGLISNLTPFPSSFAEGQQVPVLDPGRIINVLEQVRAARKYLDGPGPGFPNWLRNTIWPPRSMTIYLSTGKVLGCDELDCSLITTAEALYGTPFRLPNTNTVFYGASIGRWIFDWTCHIFSEEDVIDSALNLWKTIYILERNLFTLVHSKHGRSTDGSGELWGISKDADMFFSHFIACYRCFWSQLLSSMTKVRLPNGQSFNGIATPTVEIYAEAFLRRFFFPAPWGLYGRYKKASRTLALCLEYLKAGVAELESIEAEEEENMETTTDENKT